MEALRRTLQVSDLSPHIHPPFASRYLCFLGRSVINVPAAFDPAANAGGIALTNAEATFSGQVPDPLTNTGQTDQVQLFTPTNAAPAFDAQLVFEFNTPQGYVVVFNSWGITVVNSRPDAARVTVEVGGGPNTGVEAPHPFMSGAPRELHQPTLVILPENKRLGVKVQNLDTGSALLVQFGICGWQIPVRRYMQSLASMLPNPGFGVDCER